MIKSMTGFGRGEASAGSLRATVEIRSVNHRYADLKIRLPAELAALEVQLQKRLKKSVHRGRLDVSINLSRSRSHSAPVEVNHALVNAYVRAARGLKKEFRLAGDVNVEAVMALPDVLRPALSTDAAGSREKGVVLRAFDKAVAAHGEMRSREGEILQRDLTRRFAAIDRLKKKIDRRVPKMLPAYVKKLKDRLESLNGSNPGRGIRVDETRVAQEMVFTAERSDITEELVRLAGYVEQAGDLLAIKNGPSGKKLDFMLQEMNREANTINSKAIDLEICQYALEVKSEIEKIREQVQNIE